LIGESSAHALRAGKVTITTDQVQGLNGLAGTKVQVTNPSSFNQRRRPVCKQLPWLGGGQWRFTGGWLESLRSQTRLEINSLTVRLLEP